MKVSAAIPSETATFDGTGGPNRQTPGAGILKVLHVNGTLRRGGVETWLSQALIRMPRDRYQCDICTYRFEGGAYADGLQRYGCGLHFIPHGLGPIAIFRFSRKLRRLLREGRYDVIHCHGLLLVGFILFLAWLERIPVRIGHSHQTDRMTGSAFALAINRLALAINRPLVRAFSTHGVGCSAKAALALFGNGWRGNSKYSIIHCGIALTPFGEEANSDSWRQKLGIPDATKVIGHVSNFSVAKNTLFLIEVAASVFRLHRDVVLLLVGDGVTRRDTEQRCVDLGINSRVIFAGVSPQVPALMCFAMDVFVMPSLYEGLPLVLMEAQAAGLPCVVSDAVSHEAQAVDGAIQFMPLAVGPDAWASAVLSKLQIPARRPEALRIMKETDFDVAVSAARLGDLYDAAYASRVTGNR